MPHLRVQVYEYVEVTTKIKKQIDESDSKELCYACKEPFVEGEKIVRKCHERCRQAQNRLVAAGVTTEKQLVANGELAECATSGRKPSNPVTIRARARAS